MESEGGRYFPSFDVQRHRSEADDTVKAFLSPYRDRNRASAGRGRSRGQRENERVEWKRVWDRELE